MQIAPSLLAADFAHLAEEVQGVEQGGADLLHLDVMDGHFVPNLTFGVPVIKAIRPLAKIPFDVHLMTYHPELYIEELAHADVQMISFHAEAVTHHDRLVQEIKKRGMQAGMALNPGTSIMMVEDLLPSLDFVLIMSVNPGFGGQKFIPYSINKIRRLRRFSEERNCPTLKIEVDGGVNPENAAALKDAGADILVAGSSVFAQKDRRGAIAALRC